MTLTRRGWAVLAAAGAVVVPVAWLVGVPLYVRAVVWLFP